MLQSFSAQVRLVNEGQLRYTSNTATPVFTARAAVQTSNRKGSDSYYPSEIVELVFWGALAETASKYLSNAKGKMISVEAKFQGCNAWTGNDGKARATAQFKVVEFSLPPNGSPGVTASENDEVLDNDF